MDNASRTVSARFTPEGVDFHQGANHWGLTFRGYGYGSTLREVSATAPRGTLNRVEYHRGALTEWYVNGPAGLEQGFTLERAPGNSNGEPLTLAFALSGDLTASVDPGERSLTLHKAGAAALRYGGLTAWDGEGRELRAWLETTGNELRVRVDDAGARYPLTIDPYVQAAKLTTIIPCDASGVCDDGAPGDHLGYSVSISADASTVVVGAPFKYTNSAARGAAYVFVKPGDFDGGWNSSQPIFYRAKLLASDGANSGRFLGWSVDISRDGRTIVVGGRALASDINGAAYVYVRPPNGWESFPVQTETARLTANPVRSVRDSHSLGEAVAISGDGATIAAGAPEDRVDNVEYGAVYVFLRPATGWVNATETQKLTGPRLSYYGHSVTLSDDASIMVVGAFGENTYGGDPDESGAAYVLARQGHPGSVESYSAVARLAASDGVPFDLFGLAVGADGDGSTVVVGAPGDAYDTIRPHGAAYVFLRPTGGWGAAGFSLTESAKLTSSDGKGDDSLGVSVDISLDGNTIVAGTFQKRHGSESGPNAAYFFGKPAAGWSTSTEDTRVIASDGMSDEWFGFSAALNASGSVAVFGAPRATVGGNPHEGVTHVFTGSAATPSASVSPASLTFGPQSLGTTSSPQTVTVTNSGTAPLHVTSVGVTGPFTRTQNCVSALPIPPGGSCSENVAFAPLSVGLLTGTLSFASNSGGTSGTVQHVQLQGDGQKGNTTTTIVSVSNNPVFGSGSMFVSSIVSAEPGLTPSGTVTVQASTGESCTNGAVSQGCTLTFSTVGARTITATYKGNDSFNPSTSPGVVARVVDFTVSASPSSQSVSGRKATYKLTVTGLGGLTGTVSLTCLGGPANTTCEMSPASVTLSGSTADAKATVTLPVGAPKGTYTIKFKGTYGGETRSTTASLTVK